MTEFETYVLCLGVVYIVIKALHYLHFANHCDVLDKSTKYHEVMREEEFKFRKSESGNLHDAFVTGIDIGKKKDITFHATKSKTDKSKAKASKKKAKSPVKTKSKAVKKKK